MNFKKKFFRKAPEISVRAETIKVPFFQGRAKYTSQNKHFFIYWGDAFAGQILSSGAEKNFLNQ